MIILSLKTDKPESEIGLFDDDKKIAYIAWEAHRQLAETLHNEIKKMLEEAGKSWENIDGILMYEGPGSFTGLRIGLSVGNALAYSNGIPAVGVSGEDWLELGIGKISKVANKTMPILPVYGSEVHITLPRK